MEIGKALREAREARGASLDAVEDDIKIRHKYLEAMENEEFGILPGRVYVKGFLRNYARYLGLDADNILVSYQSQYPEEEEQEVAEVHESPTTGKGTGKGNRRFLTGGLILGGIVLVVALFAVLPLLAGKDEVHQPPTTHQEDFANNGGQSPPSDTGKFPNTPVNPVPEGVNMTLNVTDESCWMLVVVDGQTQFTGELAAGESKSFQGKQKIWIKLGKAQVVNVQINGKDLGSLGYNVKTAEYTAGSQG